MELQGTEGRGGAMAELKAASLAVSAVEKDFGDRVAAGDEKWGSFRETALMAFSDQPWDGVVSRIEAGATAEQALAASLERYADLLRGMGGDWATTANELDEVLHRALARLRGESLPD